MIKDASKSLRLLLGVLAGFGTVAAMGAIVVMAGPHAGFETGADIQFGLVAILIGVALLSRWQRHGGFAEVMVLLALDGPMKIVGDLGHDAFGLDRAPNGTVYLTWDPAIAPTVAILVAIAVLSGVVMAIGIHMQPMPREMSRVYRWFMYQAPLFGSRQGPEDDPDWLPMPPYTVRH